MDPRILLGLSAAAEDDLATRPSHHDGSEGDIIMTISPCSSSSCPRGLIRRRLRGGSLEIAARTTSSAWKGFVEVAGKPMPCWCRASAPASTIISTGVGPGRDPRRRPS